MLFLWSSTFLWRHTSSFFPLGKLASSQEYNDELIFWCTQHSSVPVDIVLFLSRTAFLELPITKPSPVLHEGKGLAVSSQVVYWYTLNKIFDCGDQKCFVFTTKTLFATTGKKVEYYQQGTWLLQPKPCLPSQTAKCCQRLLFPLFQALRNLCFIFRRLFIFFLSFFLTGILSLI